MGELVIQGEPELHRSLAGLQGDLRDLSRLNRKVAGDLAAEIGKLAPRLTGRLAASFMPSGEASKAEASSTLDYAPVQEYGSAAHNIAGQHYAERALTSSTSKIEADYREGVGELCRKAET